MKLAYRKVQKIMNNAKDFTGAMMRLYLYVAMHADESGMARGIYFRDFLECTGMTIQSFYGAKNKLEKLGYIQCYKHSWKDIDIKIDDNEFDSYEATKEGYINLNMKLFHSNEFWRLLDNEMIMALDFLKNSLSSEGGCYRIKKDRYYEKYKKIFGVRDVAIRKYSKHLQKFFSIGVKKGIVYITPRSETKERHDKMNETDQLREYIVKVAVRRTKATIDLKNKKNIMELMMQYGKVAKECGRNVYEVILCCIEKSIQISKEKRIQPAYIHKLMRQELCIQ